MGYHPMYIKLVKNRIGILREVSGLLSAASEPYLAQTRGENYNLIQLSHLLEEIIDTRTFDHVNIMPMVLDLYRDDIVRVLNRLSGVRVCIELGESKNAL